MSQFYSVPKELLHQYLPLPYLALYIELKIMARRNVIVTTPKALSHRLDMKDYTIGRMLKKLAVLDFISIKASNKNTTITLPAPAEPWVKISHEATLTSAWRKDQQHKEVFLYLMLTCAHGMIRMPLADVSAEAEQSASDLLCILDDLAADDLLLYDVEKGILTVQLLLISDNAAVAEPQSYSEATVKELQNKCKTTVTPIYDLEPVNIKLHQIS